MAQMEILRAIERAGQLTGRYLSVRLAQMALTELEAHVLMHLPIRGQAPIAELQKIFALRPSTLTNVLDRLEKRGLVARHVNPRDRRSFVVVLTPAGATAAAEVIDLMRGVEAAIRERAQTDDLRGFFDVIAAIEDVVT